jgi:hypothetical protein
MWSRPCFAVLALLALPVCGGKAVVDGASSTASGGAPPVALCPTAPPVPETDCALPDFQACSYDGTGCLQTFECQPVYPEAGAPSVWQVVADECHQYCNLEAPCDATHALATWCDPNVDCVSSLDPCGTQYSCLACPAANPGLSSVCGPVGNYCTVPWTGDPSCWSYFTCESDGLWHSAGQACA